MGNEQWYLGTTTTRMIRATPGEDKQRGEFAVVAQLEAIGIEAHAPVKVEFIRQGNRRRPDPVRSAYLPGYVFACIPDDRFHEVATVKGLSRTLMPIHKREVMQQVMPFVSAALKEYERAQRIIESNDRAQMVQYKPGDALALLSPAFQDQAARFVRMVQEAHAMYPMIEASMDLMGREVRVKIDPLDVRAAE